MPSPSRTFVFQPRPRPHQPRGFDKSHKVDGEAQRQERKPVFLVGVADVVIEESKWRNDVAEEEEGEGVDLATGEMV